MILVGNAALDYSRRKGSPRSGPGKAIETEVTVAALMVDIPPKDPSEDSRETEPLVKAGVASLWSDGRQDALVVLFGWARMRAADDAELEERGLATAITGKG